ncbi:MAG: hypothetical protein ACTSRG_13290 [Candidatus Helarchaeota archaeon]
MSQYGLPYYTRTRDIRHRLIGYFHSECGKVFFSSKIKQICPECGRGGSINKVSLIQKGIVDSISITRQSQVGMEWIRNRAVGIVEIQYNNCKVKIPTEFTDIDIPINQKFPIKDWIGKKVEPTMRILDYNPEGAIYYGVKFKPVSPNKKIATPFVNKLIECKSPGIASIGVSVPRYRTTAENMAKHLSISPNYIKKGLGINEVTVPGWDQDSGTFAMDAAADALSLLPTKIVDTIGMIVVGSESKPYSVKPTATNVLSYIDAPEDCIVYDAEFACIAAGMQIKPAISLIKSGEIDTALIIGADVAQGSPGDPLDLDTGAGAVCFVISKYNVILEYLNMNTHVGDHPDFARRKYQNYPFHGHAFTGHPSYFAFQEAAINKTLKKANIDVDDIAAATFHQPNFNFEKKEILKYHLDDKSRIERGLKPCIIGKPVIYMGNTYSAATMFGLAEIINEPEHFFDIDEKTAEKLGFEDPSKPALKLKEKDKVLTGWYGSGAGGGCAIFEITELYKEYIKNVYPFSQILYNQEEKKYVSLLKRYFAKDMIKMK